MHKLAALSITAALLLSAGLSAHAWDEPLGVRKVFRQSQAYPFIFQPPSYLATSGPVPLRFEPAPPACEQRTAPPLPKKSESTPAKPADGAPTPPAYPPPVTAPRPNPEEAIDFSRVPDEVLEFFRSHDGQAAKRIYLFDPIFQPARPNDLPKSKATYIQTP